MHVRKLVQFCQDILYAFLYAIFTLFADLPKNLMFPFQILLALQLPLKFATCDKFED